MKILTTKSLAPDNGGVYWLTLFGYLRKIYWWFMYKLPIWEKPIRISPRFAKYKNGSTVTIKRCNEKEVLYWDNLWRCGKGCQGFLILSRNGTASSANHKDSYQEALKYLEWVIKKEMKIRKAIFA
jgi:hypothetical protein